ncbi:BspA family leucine-rich repeat surface protein [Candidatus Pacearchaeota archaeon]|nr:BspA family leucine-rich repeat surface protein [Candidatus Pacearchaeota archaeon]
MKKGKSKSKPFTNTKNIFFALMFAIFVIVSIAVLTDENAKFTGHAILENETNETLINETISEINETNQTLENETILEEPLDDSSAPEEESSESQGFGIQSDFTTQGDFTIQSDTANFFVFQINTTNDYQNFSFQTDAAVSLLVDWGDGGANDTYNGDGLRSHNYTSAGIHNISIQGEASRISFYEGTPTLLTDILSPMSNGLTGINSSENMFRDAENITNFTTQDWFDEVSGNVSDMSHMFFGAINFNQNLSNWDTSKVTDMMYLFADTSLFNQPLNSWDTSNVTNMQRMFKNALVFNQSLSNWDTSKVTDMSYMFTAVFTESDFNGNISTWNTSSVTDMYSMFCAADNFNQPLNNWDTSKVTNMALMFRETPFNQNLSNWDTSNVTNMQYLFYDAISFNQPLNSWNTSSVTGTGMQYMFYNTDNFNQNLSNWDTSKVTTFRSMFDRASSFNQNLSNWDTSNVTNMQYMFYIASLFNGNISNWDVSSVTNMQRMFNSASAFNQPLNSWDVSSVIDMSSTFNGATSFNQNLSIWNISNVTTMQLMFNGVTLSTNNYDALLTGWSSLPTLKNNTEFHGGNSQYTSSASSARQSFIDNYNWSITDGGMEPLTYFTFQINTTTPDETFSFQTDDAVSLDVVWNGTNTTTYDGTGLRSFVFATPGIHNISLNGGASRISFYEGTEDLLIDILSPMSNGLTGINSSENMLRDCLVITNFTSEDWFDEVSENITTMYYMFQNSRKFNQDISNWNTSKVTNMHHTFSYAFDFNQPLNNWDTSNVLDMSDMFNYATDFNSNISTWDTSKVTDMDYMFYFATSFNQPLNNWDTSNITTMQYMFKAAYNFSQPLNSWNTSKVINMGAVFQLATSFNSNISTWDTSSVTSMTNMFELATSFNQNLSSWNVSSVATMSNIFFNSNLSTENYDSILIGWDALPTLQSEVSLVASPTKYSSTAVTARQDLINTYNWTITDGGMEPITCNNCSDCNALITAASVGDTILLSNDIDDQVGTCIDFAGKDNVTFDCQGYTIDGDYTGTDYGIYLSSGSNNNAIENCIISEFYRGIQIYDSHNNNLSNITSNNHYYGIQIGASTNNSFIDINANYNNFGVYFDETEGNKLINSSVQENNQEDIRIETSSESHCNNILTNITGSGGRPIEYYNYTATIENKILSELILCNADNSIVNNITIKGSNTIKNNMFSLVDSDNVIISNVNSSENYHGIILYNSNDNAFSDILTNNNNNGGGIYFSYYCNNNTFTNVTSIGNQNYGINIYYNSHNNTFANVVANNNTGAGVRVTDSNNTFMNVVANNNYRGLEISGTYGNRFEDIIVQENINEDIVFSAAPEIDCNNILINVTGSGGRPIEYYNYTATIENKILSELILCNADNSVINNVIVMGSDTLENNMIYMFFTDNVSLSNVDSSNNKNGIYSYESNNNSFTNVSVNDNSYGFYFRNSNNNMINDSSVKSSVVYGIYFRDSLNNTFYNNFFNNTVNYHNASVVSNYFNTTLQAGTNIVGGPNMGGNFWATPTGTGFSETCTDSNDDKICDSTYSIGGVNYDYHPLFITPPVTCHNCSDCNTKIAAASADDTIQLNTSLSNIVGTCIDFAGKDNVIFDCGGYTIDGTGSDSGIYLSTGSNDNTVKNCNISDFANGVYIYSSSNNTFTNITSNLNDYGFRQSSSSNNIFTNITSNLNDYGLNSYNSPNNIFTNIIVQENSLYDIALPANIVDCTNSYTNITGSGNRPIEFYNYTVTVENKILSELILCDADNSTINNVTISSSDILKNNALILYSTEWANMSNVNSSGVYAGIRSISSSNNIFTNITLNFNKMSGDFSSNSNNNIFMNVIANFNREGFSLSSSSNNIFTNITSDSTDYNGFYLYSSSNNTIKNSQIINNTEYGIRLGSTSNNNTFYNNFFNNTVNYYNASALTNYFNTTLQAETNIMDGPNLGGNYWAYPNGTGYSETCTDANENGICDSSYSLDGTNYDYLPLAYNASACTESWFCQDWSACNGTHQTRICTDANACGTTVSKPIEIQECTGCQEDWTCTAWSTCVSSSQTRTCTDDNNCGTEENKSAETQSCTVDDGGSSGSSSTSTVDPETGIAEVVNDTIVTVFPEMNPDEPTNITINDSDFGLTGVSIDVGENVTGVSISIEEVENITEADLRLGVTIGKVFETYEIFIVEKEGITNDQIDSVTLDFKITREWIEEKVLETGFNEDKIVREIEMFKRQNDSDVWIKVKTDFIYSDEEFFYFQATTDGFSIFVMGLVYDDLDETELEEIETKEEKQDKFIIIMIIALVFSILVLLTLIIFYKKFYGKKKIEKIKLVNKVKAHKIPLTKK